MSHLVNIAFQGGTHGNYLRFCIDKFSTLTPDMVGTPFSENKTSHNKLNYSNLIRQYHPSLAEPFFQNTNEPHILITVEEADLLYLERWVTMRAGDHKIDVSADMITTTKEFLEAFGWTDKFKKYYNLDLPQDKIPKFLMRDFYKLCFLDPIKNGFVERDIQLQNHLPSNIFCFPVSSFWNKDKFFNTLQQASDHLDLALDLSNRTFHDSFIDGLNFLETKDRAHDVIQAIQNNQDVDISTIDVVEQAYVSAWLENNNEFVIVPLCDQFFQTTGEIVNWLEHYPQHYKAMNPNLPTFNNIPNPFHLWNLKK